MKYVERVDLVDLERFLAVEARKIRIEEEVPTRTAAAGIDKNLESVLTPIRTLD